MEMVSDLIDALFTALTTKGVNGMYLPFFCHVQGVGSIVTGSVVGDAG